MRRVFGFLAVLLLIGATVLSAQSAVAQETVTIQVGDNDADQWWFCDPSFFNGVCETTINVGDTVAWNFSSAGLPHTTTECGASCPPGGGYTSLWDSGFVPAEGGTFEHTFDQPGEYLYYCQVHPVEMRGRIIVQDAQPAPTNAPTDGQATATPTAGGTQFPQTGTGADAGSSGGWLVLAMLAGAGVALVGLGAVSYRRVRVKR